MSHHCHAPGCHLPTAPKLFMCKAHWYMLPKAMRDAIWSAYQKGQEQKRVRPTPEYFEAARAARNYIADLAATTPPQAPREPR